MFLYLKNLNPFAIYYENILHGLLIKFCFGEAINNVKNVLKCGTSFPPLPLTFKLNFRRYRLKADIHFMII